MLSKAYQIDEWKIIEDGFDPENHKKSESIFSLGNGKFGQRANFEESYSGESMQGTYIAGVYYPDKTRVGWWKNGYPEYFAKVLNAPYWNGIDVFINGMVLDLAKWKISGFKRVLDMHEGVLSRNFIAEKDDIKIQVSTQRFISIVDDECACIKYSVTLIDCDAEIKFISKLDADVKNEDSNYDEQFWESEKVAEKNGVVSICASTKKTGFVVGCAMKNSICSGKSPIQGNISLKEKSASETFSLNAKAGDDFTLYKYVSVVSSLFYSEDKIENRLIGNLDWISCKSYYKMLDEQKLAWANKWEHSDIRLFRSGDRIKVKHLVVEPIHVEHSIPGAYGFIVHTSRGALAYTGDLRLHGPKKGMTEEFLERAAASKPVALLCEGTRMGGEEGHNFTEEEIEGKIGGFIREARGAVFANFSMSNIDRFMSFYHAAVENGRKLVVDTNFAYILDNLKDKIGGLPDVRNDPNIFVYYRLKKSGKFEQTDYQKWEREFWNRKITYREIKEKQKGYVMHITFYKLMELVYIQPKGATYIYSQSEHFLEGEENKEQREVLENWMRHFKMEFRQAHCSGHASRQDIAEIVRRINPKLLIPIHTQKPEEFRKLHGNVKVPEKGKRIEF